MQWYLLKTWAGREKEVMQEIRRTVPGHMYKECFVIDQERIWRKQQKSIVHVEPLFRFFLNFGYDSPYTQSSERTENSLRCPLCENSFIISGRPFSCTHPRGIRRGRF